MGAASNYHRSGGNLPAWLRHYTRVRSVGGATAAATVDIPFLKAYYQQATALRLRVLADLSPRFGYLLDNTGRVSRLFEPLGKDLVSAAGFAGPALTQRNGHAILSFDGSSCLLAADSTSYDLVDGDLVSYVAASSSNTSSTSSIYAKAVARDQDYRYSLIFDGGQLYSLYQVQQSYNASSAPPAAGWQELGQRIRRGVGTNELLIGRATVGSTAFTAASGSFASPYRFFLGAYASPADDAQPAFFFAGLIDRVRLLSAWPGAATDPTIWDTLTS